MRSGITIREIQIMYKLRFIPRRINALCTILYFDCWSFEMRLTLEGCGAEAISNFTPNECK